MPAERRPGMDHEHYDWSPIQKRGVLRWPNEARVAVCVIVTLEKMEWQAPDGSFTVSLAGGIADRPFPDYARVAHREYGHRVGIFRVLDVLEKHGIKPTVAMDAQTAEINPYLVSHCLQRGCEIIAHGASASQMITSRMSEDTEREYIQASVGAIRQATGTQPRGWLGPEYGESARTPEILRQAGVSYVCDWVNDEQPYPLKSGDGQGLGPMFALPVMWELDDINALWDRKVPVDRYCRLIQESFDTLYEDSAKTGRLIVLNLHPWVMGQPYRIGFLDQALSHIVRRQGVWAASGSEIIDWYRDHPPEDVFN